MTEVCAVVLGAGSIGARHAANLRDLGATVRLMDPDADRARAVPGCEGGPLDLDAICPADVVVVASPTLFHAEHTRAALAATDGVVMVEKPLCLTTDDHHALACAGAGRLMVGFNLRCHEPVARTIEMAHSGAVGEPVGMRLWFGSWLPDWRPAVDYRTTYSARRDLGGGVLLDAIHELDLALWLAGPDLAVAAAVVGRFGPLEIDVEDTVRAQLTTPNGIPVEVSLDYLSRRYRRGIEVIGSDATLRLDWNRRTLALETADRVRHFSVDWDLDASYAREAALLLEFAEGRSAPPVDGHGGAAAMELARCILATANAGGEAA